MELLGEFITANHYLVVYFLLLAVYLILEISYLITVNWRIYKTGTRIKKANIDKSYLLKNIENEFISLYKHSSFQINTAEFVRKRLEGEWDKLLRGFYFIKRTDLIYILLGLLGAVFSAAGFLLSQDFSGLEDLQYIVDNLSGQFRAALVSILFGIFCTVILKVFIKIIGTEKNLDNLVEIISDYLEEEVKQKIEPGRMPEVEAINDLIEVTEKGFTALQEIIDAGLSEITARIEKLENQIDEIKAHQFRKEEGEEDEITDFNQLT